MGHGEDSKCSFISLKTRNGTENGGRGSSQKIHKQFKTENSMLHKTESDEKGSKTKRLKLFKSWILDNSEQNVDGMIKRDQPCHLPDTLGTTGVAPIKRLTNKRTKITDQDQ